MNIYLEAFGIFFKIGAFTIGGGYAMVPLIEMKLSPNGNGLRRKILSICWLSPNPHREFWQSIFLSLQDISCVESGEVLSQHWEQFCRLSLLYWLSPCSFIVSKTIRQWNVFLKEFARQWWHSSRRRPLPWDDPQNQPLQSVDSCCLGNINLAVGLLPYLDYYCGRCRRFPVGEIQKS